MTTEMRERTADLMTIVLGREVKDYDTIHCGAFTPLVLASGMWAMAHHAPHSAILPLSLTGVINRSPFPISLSLVEGMNLASGVQYPMVDVFTHVEGVPGCAYEPVNPLQVDARGNVNTSVLGEYDNPKFRGPGPAGLDTLTIMMNHALILYCPRHSRKILVPKVDFVTAVGNDAERRKTSGVSTGGVRKLVTNLCVIRFLDDGTAELESVHEGVTTEEVLENTGFDLAVPHSVPATSNPTPRELEILKVIDPLCIRGLEFMTASERLAELPDIWEREWHTFQALASEA